MDDSNDKIRRNLVLVSSGIILAAWLEIPGGLLLGSLVSKPLSVPPEKLWAVGFTLLAYLGWRYRFTQDGQSFAEELRSGVKQAINQARWTDANRAAQKYSKTGVVSPVLIDLEKSIEEVWTSSPHRGGAYPRPSVHLNNFESETSGFISSATLTIGWRDEDGGMAGTSATSKRVSFKFVGWRLGWQKLRARATAWFYTEVAVQKLAPILIAYFAECVLWFRLASAYLAV